MSTAPQRIANALRKYQKRSLVVMGTLGNVNGVVAVPNKPNYVYVTIPGSGTDIVYNKRVANSPGLPVDVGRDPIEPDIYQVLNVHRYPQADPTSTLGLGSIGNHASTHNWAGSDPTFIEKRQIMPMRPTPIGGMQVYITRDVVRYNDQWMGITGQVIDFSGATPPTGSYYGMLYLDTDGNPGVLTGTLTDLLHMDINSVPAPYPGTVPLAMVRLYAGQSGILEGLNDTDLIDIRGIINPVTEGYIPAINVTGVANPPTKSNLDTLLGTPGGVGMGFTRILYSGVSGTYLYLVTSDGANWWTSTLDKAT